MSEESITNVTTEKKAGPQDILYKELSEVALEMGSKLDAERPAWGPSDHSRYNWASEFHHPCKKFLVHCRLDWPQRQGIDLDGRWRTEEGHDKEWAIKKWLGNVGFEITRAQQKFRTDEPGLEEFANLWISGKIDGASPMNRALPAPFEKTREVPIEVKSISPHYWASTTTIENIKKHKKFWIAKIPSQLNTYLALDRSPAGLLALATFGKKPRILPMLFDEELWEYDKKIALAVNAHVAAGTYPPPIPFDTTICGMCDFNHICTPLKTTELIEISNLDAYELEAYLELKEQNKQFKAMHSELIGTMEKPGKYHGKEALVSDIEIKTTKSPRKKYPGLPPEIKEPYAVEYELVQTTIERVTK